MNKTIDMNAKEFNKALRRIEKIERRGEAIERRTVHLVNMLDTMAKILEEKEVKE